MSQATTASQWHVANDRCCVSACLYLMEGSPASTRRMYCVGTMQLCRDVLLNLPGWSFVLYAHFPSLAKYTEGVELLKLLALESPDHNNQVNMEEVDAVMSPTEKSETSGGSSLRRQTKVQILADDQAAVEPFTRLAGGSCIVRSSVFPHLMVVPADTNSPACMLERFRPFLQGTPDRPSEPWNVVLVRDCDRLVSKWDAALVYRWLRGIMIETYPKETVLYQKQHSIRTRVTLIPETHRVEHTTARLLRYYDPTYAVKQEGNIYEMGAGVPIVGGSFAIALGNLLPDEVRTSFQTFYARLLAGHLDRDKCKKATKYHATLRQGVPLPPQYCCDQFWLRQGLWDCYFKWKLRYSVVTVPMFFTSPSQEFLQEIKQEGATVQELKARQKRNRGTRSMGAEEDEDEECSRLTQLAIDFSVLTRRGGSLIDLLITTPLNAVLASAIAPVKADGIQPPVGFPGPQAYSSNLIRSKKIAMQRVTQLVGSIGAECVACLGRDVVKPLVKFEPEVVPQAYPLECGVLLLCPIARTRRLPSPCPKCSEADFVEEESHRMLVAQKEKEAQAKLEGWKMGDPFVRMTRSMAKAKAELEQDLKAEQGDRQRFKGKASAPNSDRGHSLAGLGLLHCMS